MGVISVGDFIIVPKGTQVRASLPGQPRTQRLRKDHRVKAERIGDGKVTYYGRDGYQRTVDAQVVRPAGEA